MSFFRKSEINEVEEWVSNLFEIHIVEIGWKIMKKASMLLQYFSCSKITNEDFNERKWALSKDK